MSPGAYLWFRIRGSNEHRRNGDKHELDFSICPGGQEGCQGGVTLLALGLALLVGVGVSPTPAIADQIKTCGDFTVTVAEGDAAEYSYENGELRITGGTLTVGNTNPSTPTNNRIVISGHVDVTFAGVNIERSTSGSPVEVDDHATTNVTIRLRNENKLVSSTSDTPALRKGRKEAAGSDVGSLKITSAERDGSAAGSLTARSTGNDSAGIGSGGYHGDVANITIAGGTVDASAKSGASIGATGGGSTWNLVISGGIVKAVGGDGLGAVSHSNTSNFEISGGYVVTNVLRGSVPTGGLVSTDSGTSFTARGNCLLPTSQSPLSAERLTIEPGATLTIPKGASMTVNETVINNGTLAGAGTLVSSGTFYNNGTIVDCVVEGKVTEQLVTIESGTANGSTDPQTVSAGSTVTLQANEVTGMVFTGWEVTMGHGVELVDPAAAETTFSMPSGSCVTIRATYEYLFGTIVTEAGEEIPVTGEGPSDSYAAIRDSGWQNYPNSTFRLTAPDETAEGVSNRLSLPNELPACATIDLNDRTMSCDHLTSYHVSAASQLCVRNGTLVASYGSLYVENIRLTLEGVTLSAADSWDGSLNIYVGGSASSLTFGEGTSLSGNTTSVTIGGYRGSVTIPCALAQDEHLSIEGEINVNRVHSWTATTGGAAACASCGLRRGSAELSLSPAEGLVYDGESLTAADAGVTATRDGADCSNEVVLSWQRVNSDGSLGVSESGLPRDAGTYQITATLYGSSTEDTAYDTLTETATVSVAPKPVTVHFDGAVSAQGKVYDGTTTAELSGIPADAAFQLDGVLDRDQSRVQLSLDGVHGEFADAGAGTEKGIAVLLDNPSLSSPNYTLSSNEVQLGSSVTASIDPRPVKLEWQGVTGRFFGDGRSVTALVAGAVEGDDVLAQVSNGNQVEAGTYTATAELAGSDAGNYMLAEDAQQSVEYTVAPAVVAPDGTQASSLNDAGVAQTSFVFGEKIVVRVKPAYASSEQGTRTLALTEPAPEQMALYYGNTQISDPVSAASDGSYTMTYDTSEGIVPAGAEAETLVARLVGSENVSDFEVAVQVSIAKAPQAAPEGVVPTNELTVGDGGQLSGLPAGGEWRPAGEGAWRPVPEGGAVSGLPAGDYEVRLPESETHAASDAVKVTIKDFSSAHGGITYPAGTTDAGDGLATLPDGGGSVTFPNGATVVLPGGSTVDPEAQVATTPSGVEVAPDGDGLSVRLPGGAVVNAGSATVGQDGTVAFPNGGTITYQDGTTGQVGSGETVEPDVTAPEQGDGTSNETTPGSEGEPEPTPGAEDDSEPTPETETPEADGLAQTGDVVSFLPAVVAGAAGLTAAAGALTLRRRSK